MPRVQALMTQGRITSCAVSTRFAAPADTEPEHPQTPPPGERPLKVQPADGALILKPADVVPQMGHMIPDDFFTGFGATQAMVVSMLAGPCLCGVWATLLHDSRTGNLALLCRGCGRSVSAAPAPGEQEWQAMGAAIDRWRAGMVDTRR